MADVAIKRGATSAEGFFQELPRIPNQFYEDASLKRAMSMFLPREVIDIISADLSSFGDRVLSPSILSLVKDAEVNPPRLETWDTFGRRKDELIASNGWKQLQALGIAEGIVAIPYEKPFKHYSRLYQFFKQHLWSGSNAIVTCPSAMTDGAAALLKRHLKTDTLSEEQKAAFESAYRRLTSRDPSFAWTSGQWMTERAGGSDVSNTETRARKIVVSDVVEPELASDESPLGPWSIDGFKWFSSATDADMSVLLAKTPASTGDEELSAFLAPTRRKSKDAHGTISTSNGVHPQRLKSKLGTKPLPTAELELKGMRGHLLGQQGKGVKEISTVLNITRVYNAVSAMGSWGRGLAIARAWARVRLVRGRPLIENPAHMRDLSCEHVEYRAFMLFAHFVVALLGAVEHHVDTDEFVPFHGIESPGQATILLRLLTPVIKAETALAAINSLRWAMESMGGVGYLENEDPVLNIARIFRDTNVLAIWEGTTNVMAEDTVRVIKHKSEQPSTPAVHALGHWIKNAWPPSSSDHGAKQDIQKHLEGIRTAVASSEDPKALLYQARDVMNSIAYVVTTTLLLRDAQSVSATNVNAMIASRWMQLKSRCDGQVAVTMANPPVASIQQAIKIDKAIIDEYNAAYQPAPTLRL